MKKIKQFKKENLTECSRLYVDVFSGQPWNENWTFKKAYKRLSNFLKLSNFKGYIFFEGKILGFIGGFYEEFLNGTIFRLEELLVIQESREKGIGTELLKYLENQLESENIVRIYLRTLRNSDLEKFYKKREYKTNIEIIEMSKELMKI